MKVVLAFDMGTAYIEKLQAAFPSVEFCAAYTAEEQIAAVKGARCSSG